MTIQDLMRHTSGLTYGNRGKTEVYKMYPESSNVASLTLTMDEFIEQLSRIPLLYQPGTRWEYGLSTDVLGRVVEIVSGKSLGEVLAERIYRPLKMTDTTFLVPGDKRARVAQGLPVHPDTGAEFKLADPSCQGSSIAAAGAPYQRQAITRDSPRCSSTAAASTAHACSSPRTVEFMTADHLGSDLPRHRCHRVAGLHLGARRRGPPGQRIAPIPGSAGDFYWPGAFATYWWADPKEELAVVFMTQSPLGGHYAHLMRGLVYQAIAN